MAGGQGFRVKHACFHEKTFTFSAGLDFGGDRAHITPAANFRGGNFNRSFILLCPATVTVDCFSRQGSS
ncbi:predicted protein [Brucella neotomae 5K33]|uniref:Uncharacterized protein n=1 Tax=Brucella neotomae 5K33 TaxID=520456 RepID=A0A7U8K5L4_BRUNE|nr:predicted protein [Brucella neotomae 5K33]